MEALETPPEGLILRHDSKGQGQEKHSNQAAQVIRLELVETVTKEILRSLKNNEQVRLRCGKRPAVQFGKRTITLASNVDTFPSEVFTRPTNDDTTLYFSGRLSHKLEIEKAVEDTAKSDEALAALESTLRSLQEQRASNETSIIGGKEDLRHGGRKDNRPSPLLGQGSALRKDHHLLGGLARSTPASPFLSASYSPRIGPTSAPMSSGLTAKDRVRLDAVRIPLVHLLATRPMKLKAIAAQLRATEDDCGKILDKVARDFKTGDGLKELKEKSYRELDVWKFPYRSREDRQSAIDRAIQAFDRMRVEKKDNLWQLLLPQEERGKGKLLSKLNFDKRVPSHATPKPDGAGEEGNESKAELSDRDHSKTRTHSDGAVVQKKPKDKMSSAKNSLKTPTAGVAKVKESSQSQSKAAKPDGKFKSSERIEDSDEEADAADEAIAKPREPSKTQATTSKKPAQDSVRPAKPLESISSPRKSIHKPSFSNSSSSSNSGNEKLKSTATNPLKSMKPHQRTDSTASRISPRPRHNSSPQKPSPLGSSPPTTSTDVDNSSSSKSSNQSSAPSSPPSDKDMPKPKQGNKYSPVISDKSRNVSRGRSPGRMPAKRKAAPAEEERPTKRPQPSSSHLTPLPTGAADIVKRPTTIRTDSERSSSPEKPGINRDGIIEDARRFQKYYRRYKDLYDRISQLDEKERDDKDMVDLWKMHKRLKEMKADIWDNWDKVDKPDPAREMVAV